jgi:very-short-patch-repair endonuclease
VLQRLATRQHGVVSLEQLRALGFTDRTAHDRAAAGRLLRLHRGVYAVGHGSLSQHGRWLAAVLAVGPEAVLSHAAALALWRLRPRRPGPIDVTVAGRGRRAGKGIALHCVRALAPADRMTIDAIPVTTVARTLLDYAEQASAQQLRLALEAADRRELLDVRAIEALLARTPGRHGARALRSAVTAMAGPAPETRSELERAMLALVRDGGLPEPQCNVLLHGYSVDMLWPEARLVVELDGYPFHRTRRAFEDDRRRDARLQAAGYRVLRITARRLREEPEEVLAEIAGLLGQ